MSGHSKWKTIKHRKSKEDAKRGKLFSKLTKAIIVAAKKGGGDPDQNIALANAIQKAKEFNMPKDNIKRAIKKGTGKVGGYELEKVVYEGYGPEGIAVIVETMTDNRKRTASEMRNIFAKHNGNLGSTGCVGWMFNRKGVISLKDGSYIDEDEILLLAIDAGADDVIIEKDYYEIYTEPTKLMKIKDFLIEKGLSPDSTEIILIPKNYKLLDESKTLKTLKLIDALNEQEDVQEIYTNFEIPDELMEKL